ncbi:Glycosyl transferase, family 2 [Microbacterium esteraromaticum]|uniref:Glycosyl transferase, family 2 n=1 Tax=Microbacterium esteraromaticum TaxID=57043 RepID=A0A1R4JG25_9MICO|nr:glycosyltransferase [Microbacterium esteraromaticum]SJN30713.1 Glycosyl transferase, family 2 [Microbacterium esteraromaticum]
MPARVHAIIVARSGESASAQLARTLEALRAQSIPPAAMTVVVQGDASRIRSLPGIGHAVEAIIEARPSTSYSESVALAAPRVAEGRSVWLLAHDTVPERNTLRQLTGALERSPSAAIAAPKLVRADDDREIVSMGVSMTRFGRTVELAAEELDQGQHDSTEDALGADVRGLLIRGEAPRVLRPDTALAGADEGLDLGVRARLGGARLVLVPKARIGVRPNGPAAVPLSPVARAWATRRAQLHRRLAYAPALAVPLHWLSLLPLALWRSITHLIAKRPAEVAPEWGAALATMLRLGALARSRSAIRSFRSASWASIAALRVTREQLKQRLDDGHGSERGVVSELNFFSGGGAWAVLAALVVSVAAFVSMLAWPALGGGELLPLQQTVAALWSDTTWGLRDVGLGIIGPADPFAAVIAVLGTLWPAAPSFSLVLLWLAALPLGVLGGWFAATRITDRAGLRILGGVLWALAPTFLTALVQGRPAAVLLHLLLPWVFHSAVVAHRSWGAAGAASLLTAAALACAPSLAPAFVLLWALSLIIMLTTGRLRGAARLFWVLIPSAVMFAPLVIWQLRHGNPWALLADPGAVSILDQAGADAAGRAVIASGFPSPDRAGWEWFAGTGFSAWVSLLLAPVALLALMSALSPRWRAGFAMLATGLAGLATALAAARVVVSFADGIGVAIWPGTGLSLAWLGVAGAALVTLDTVVAAAPLRITAAFVAGVAVGVCALPALLAVNDGNTELQNGPKSTLPALVAAQAGSDSDQATLVMTALNDGSLSIDLVWGSSATLGAQSTLHSTATRPAGTDISVTAVDLLSARSFDAAQALADHSISFVLLAQTADEKDRARMMREQATTAIDQRSGFVKAGDTARGTLWRVDDALAEITIAERAQPSDGQQAISRTVALAQAIILLAALLLAIPTRASRRAARAKSRVVGRTPEESLASRSLRARNDDDELAEPPAAVSEPRAETEQNADADSPPATAEPQESAPERGTALERDTGQADTEPADTEPSSSGTEGAR